MIRNIQRVKASEPIKDTRTPREKAEEKSRQVRTIVSIAGIFLTLLGAITFTEFIYEEALQQIGMSCFVLRSVGTPDEIRDCGANLREEAEKVLDFIESVGKVNPLTYRAFRKFAETSIQQGRAYEKLGDYLDPTLPAAYTPWDSEDEKREYKESGHTVAPDDGGLCNGTSCHLLNGWGE